MIEIHRQNENLRYVAIGYPEEQIRTWIRRNRPPGQELSRQFLANAAKLPPQDSLADRVLIIGRTAIFHSSATVPAAARQKP
jgi:hypothetical protein